MPPFEIEPCAGAAAPPAPGARAPRITWHDETGRLRTLGVQPVVLAFCGDTWDPARREELARYRAMLRDLPGGGVLLSDEDGAEADWRARYGVDDRAATFLIDGDGIVRWRHVASLDPPPSLDALHAALRGNDEAIGVSRRTFLLAGVAFAIAASVPLDGRAEAGAAPRRAAPATGRATTLNVNGQRLPHRRRRPHHAARRAARAHRPHRHEERLRPRPVRRLHRARRRPPHQLVPDARATGGGPADHDDRRSRARRRLHPMQAAFIEARRLPVRLLHARPDHVRGRLHRRGPRRQPTTTSGVDERQHLPLRRLQGICDAIARGAGRGEEARLNELRYDRAATVRGGDAPASRADPRRAVSSRGGTNLVDLMKYGVERRRRVVDVTRLPLATDRAAAGRRLAHRRARQQQRPGRATRVSRALPRAVAQALLAGASPQLRNMATTGGNLLQRTRCYYFYDTAFPCNKRAPGSGCAAIGGQQPHPRDPRAERRVHRDASERYGGRAGGARRASCRCRVPTARAPFRSPSSIACRATRRTSTPICSRDELIVAVDLPPPSSSAARSRYLKVRDRAQYAFALVSAAVARGPGGRHDPRRAHRARRRRAQAVARA